MEPEALRAACVLGSCRNCASPLIRHLKHRGLKPLLVKALVPPALRVDLPVKFAKPLVVASRRFRVEDHEQLREVWGVARCALHWLWSGCATLAVATGGASR